MSVPAHRPTPAHPTPTQTRTRTRARARARRLWVAGGLVLIGLAAAGVVWAVLAARPQDSAGPHGPSETEASGPTATGRTLSVLDMGAVGDGTTDDTKALQAAFDAAGPGDTVLLPAGRTFAHADLLSLTTADVTLTGGGELLATDEERSSLVLAADGILLDDISLDVRETTRRWDAYEQQRLRLDGHRGIVVRDVRVEGSAAAGIYVGGASADFLLDRVQVGGTRADGIHITQGAHDGRVVAPQVRDVGDDGVAVVSYQQDGEPCARISIDSPVVDGSTGGRGISVVGGADVTYSDIDVSNTYAAGIYVAAEGSYGTAGVRSVDIDGGSVSNANQGADVDHGAVLVYNGTADQTVAGVTVSDIAITGTRESASRWVGLVADGQGQISDAVLSDLSLDGTGPAEPFVSNAETTTYRTEGWTRDGRELPDRADEPVPGADGGEDDDEGAAPPTLTGGASGTTAGSAVTASTTSSRGAGATSDPGAVDVALEKAAAADTDPAEAAAPARGPSGRSIAVQGAGDGVTDDTSALQAAFDSAGPGDTVLVPAGRTFAHDDVLRITKQGVWVTGGGTLLATDEERSSVVIAADGVVLQDLTLRIEKTSRRWDAYEQQHLRLDGHSGIVVRDVRVVGSAAAGVYVGGGASGFLLQDVEVSNTRADGIHMTQGVHDGRVVDPVLRNVGDDGVAVVSYAQDGAPCKRITVSRPLVDGSTGGRGVSVVGGEDITYRDIDVRDTYAAGVYIAAEGGRSNSPWTTSGVDGVIVQGGRVSGANDGKDIDHGALLVYDETPDKAVRDVTISGLELSGTRASASRWVGLVADSTGRIQNVSITDLSITGGPRTSFVSNSSGTRFRLSGWTRDGQAVPAQQQG